MPKQNPIRRYPARKIRDFSDRLLDSRVAALLGAEAAYGAFLVGSGDALFPIEAALSQAGAEAVLPDWPQRARSGALREDLAEFGAEASAPVAAPLFLSRASLYGALYMLEGSRLGAKALAQLHGARAGFWQSFLTRLEGDGAAREGVDGAVASARATFAAFGCAMERATNRLSAGRGDG